MSHLPDIDCVLIGVNCSKTLGRCIDSVFASDYPKEKIHPYYVDGGSADRSIEVAKGYESIKVIAINPEYPTPGLGRNHGWKQGSSQLVQFLDSDTILNPDWLKIAVRAMDEEQIGAVMGFRKEMHPEHSIYNWIGDLEWNGPVGESSCFGGDVLMRRKVLEKTDGYDELLVGGEDPELSRRIIRAGWKIIRLDALMTQHDLAMKTVRQYLTRAFRSGYGFAAVRKREAEAGSDFWKYEFQKIVIKGGMFFTCIIFSLLILFIHQLSATISLALLTVALGTGILLNPRLFKVNKFMRENNLNNIEARIYAWHCSLVVIPQLFGLIRFYVGLITNNPLTNKRNTLATGLSVSEI
ncbi:MAG: glycosyltransferase [Chlorobium sp.]|jgi:cellulose synthase/poly-beta-1,6-N-acetylglucosamine synthase-like glycosyltransferase|nr:glycosyltransferase [Chlorobium sp.]